MVKGRVQTSTVVQKVLEFSSIYGDMDAFVVATEWQNGDGWDISINSKNRDTSFSLTWEEWRVLRKLMEDFMADEEAGLQASEEQEDNTRTVVLGLRRDQVESFFEFCIDRHDIYIRKEIDRAPAPWTTDNILKNFKFCNIFRELDAGTRVIATRHWEDPLDALLNIVCYRFFNRRDHFERIGEVRVAGWDPEEFLRRVEMAKAQGPVFSDAYLVHGNEKHIARRLQWVIDNGADLLQALGKSGSAADSYRALRRIDGVGQFIGYQMWLDASYHGLHPWTGDDFVVVGPGSKWGLALMTGRPDVKGVKNAWCVSAMEALRDEQGVYLESIERGKGKRLDYERPMSLEAIEHALCEWRKYQNLVGGFGRKRKFSPKQRA